MPHWNPPEALQIDAIVLVEFDAFVEQELALQFVASTAGQGDFAVAVDDAVPGQIRLATAVQDAAYLARMSRRPGQGGNLAIGSDAPGRDLPDYLDNAFGEVFWQR